MNKRVVPLFPHLFLFLSIVWFVSSCSNKKEKKESDEDWLKRMKIAVDSTYEDGNYEMCLNYLNEVVKRDSLNGEWFYKRGYCKAQLFRDEEACVDFLVSGLLGYRTAYSYYNLGLCHLGLGRDSLGIHYLGVAVNLDPSSGEMRFVLDSVRKELDSGN